MKKKIIPVFLLLIIGGSLFYWYHGKERSMVLRGEVEGTTYSHVAEVAGKIIEMNVELGSPVKAGELIARLDNTDQKYALEQMQIALEKRRLTLKSMQDDLEPVKEMWKTGGASQSELDKAIFREALAKEDILDAESNIRQMEETLDKYEIMANCDGIVISTNYKLGSMVNPGYNLADISADKEKYVVCYFPREQSLEISYGQLFRVRSGKEEYQGEVRFIDVKSQYTPKDMQTTIMKNKVSVKVKLLLPHDTMFKPGNWVEVVVR